MVKFSLTAFREFAPFFCICIGIAKCSTILQPEFRNNRLNSTLFHPRAGRTFSSKINGYDKGEGGWISEGADNHVSSSDLTSVSEDQYNVGSVSHSQGYDSEPSHTKISYSHGKAYPSHHGWTSHTTHQHGWDGWKPQDHGWGTHEVSYGHEGWGWHDSWTKIKSWLGIKSLWGSAFLLSIAQGLLVFVPMAILIGLLIHYREDVIPKLNLFSFLPTGCLRSSSNELWRTTNELTHKILSSEDCVHRIACEIGQSSFVDSLSSYLSTGNPKGNKEVQSTTDGTESNKVTDGPCVRYSCDPIGGFKELFN